MWIGFTYLFIEVVPDEAKHLNDINLCVKLILLPIMIQTIVY